MLVISRNLVLGEASLEIPLSHPRIMWDSVGRRGTLTVSSEEEGFEGANLVDDMTWDFWRPTSLPATILLDTDEAEQYDYALFAAHTLSGVIVTLDYWDGDAFQQIAQVLPGNNRVLGFLFEPVSTTRFRVTLSSTGSSEIPSIGIYMAGKALAMERRLFREHNPVTLARKTVIRSQLSDEGQLLGRSILYGGVQTSIKFNNLTQDWVREFFEPFVLSARSKPFGWAWYPSKFPDEIALLWTDQDIRPVNTGPRDLMGVSFPVEGIVE